MIEHAVEMQGCSKAETCLGNGSGRRLAADPSISVSISKFFAINRPMNLNQMIRQ